MSASSFASAMLTARKVFSCSFAVSATIGLETGTTSSTICRYRSSVRRRHSSVTPATSFGVVLIVAVLVARVDALGRVAEEDVLADHGPGRLEDRLDDLVRRPRVGRRLEDDEHPRAAGSRRPTRPRRRRRRCPVCASSTSGVGTQIVSASSSPRARSRSWRGQVAVEAFVARGGHVHEVRACAPRPPGRARVEVDAGDVEAGLGERHRQREPGIAEPDDAQLAPRAWRCDRRTSRGVRTSVPRSA